ncbi:MAG: formylglycine-generating enzyme family protein [Opitutae bacterium]|nr:formylglycine-generating enzyme family protein [Opitutae bacterium]
MPRARSTPCALAALFFGAAPLAHAAPAIDASSYVAIAATGELVPDPVARATYAVADGARTLAIPQGMDYVPAGSFTMGEGAHLHPVKLDAFAIGRFEVTNAEWLEFVDATGRPPPPHWPYGMPPIGTMGLPVTFVTWQDAQDFCAWRSAATGWNFTLPTEAQWEHAARGTRGAAFPWGANPDATFVGDTLTSRCNYRGVCAAGVLARTSRLHFTANTAVARVPDTFAALDATRSLATNQVLAISADGMVANWQQSDPTLATFVASDEFTALVAAGGAAHTVGSFPAGQSDLGPLDMAGNVAEWVADWFAADYDRLSDAAENPHGPDAATADPIPFGARLVATKVVRGGSWADALAATCSTARDFAPPASASATIGFRVAIRLPKTSDSSASTESQMGPALLASIDTAAELDPRVPIAPPAASASAARTASVPLRPRGAASVASPSAWFADAALAAGFGLGALLSGGLIVFFLRRKKT